MKWIGYWVGLSLFASVALVSSTTATPASGSTTQQEESESEDEDFIPTEKVPADSAISFPVDI